MTDIHNIISTKIIDSEWDELWVMPDIANLKKGAGTLVIAATYDAGGAEDIQLRKMLQACQLNDSDYNIIQLAEGRKMAWHQLRDSLAPKYMLLLGVAPQQLGISAVFQLFHPNTFNDSIFIPGLSLQEAEKQPEAKKQLWMNGLKPIFIDKVNN